MLQTQHVEVLNWPNTPQCMEAKTSTVAQRRDEEHASPCETLTKLQVDCLLADRLPKDCIGCHCALLILLILLTLADKPSWFCLNGRSYAANAAWRRTFHQLTNTNKSAKSTQGSQSPNVFVTKEISPFWPGCPWSWSNIWSGSTPAHGLHQGHRTGYNAPDFIRGTVPGTVPLILFGLLF